jgi:hypothetical protein
MLVRVFGRHYGGLKPFRIVLMCCVMLVETSLACSIGIPYSTRYPRHLNAIHEVHSVVLHQPPSFHDLTIVCRPFNWVALYTTGNADLCRS